MTSCVYMIYMSAFFIFYCLYMSANFFVDNALVQMVSVGVFFFSFCCWILIFIFFDILKSTLIYGINRI